VIVAGASSKANATVLSKPCGPVMSTHIPSRDESAAIRSSYGGARRGPAAATAASIRSRRAAEIPLQSKTARGMEGGQLADIASYR
jgi:hypothetical protein